ncbi:hypothetical protein BDK51DRAFT_29507 [Blyttiomyces helicus]|uniref:Uncharacterized protein n=1 Tax=Blyttiomyces helicus TaxID=388810 RepID=A0A4P9WQH7_9FUNG|nr:hypothetical protein BDK51DRAFT_29507 [Blyttiomyces helicus]|eukprot:RKO94423.1 hypothetical protein BDK51DRAFT_29507 [Blyttiomyces helicus]
MILSYSGGEVPVVGTVVVEDRAGAAAKWEDIEYFMAQGEVVDDGPCHDIVGSGGRARLVVQSVGSNYVGLILEHVNSIKLGVSDEPNCQKTCEMEGSLGNLRGVEEGVVVSGAEVCVAVKGVIKQGDGSGAVSGVRGAVATGAYQRCDKQDVRDRNC